MSIGSIANVVKNVAVVGVPFVVAGVVAGPAGVVAVGAFNAGAVCGAVATCEVVKKELEKA